MQSLNHDLNIKRLERYLTLAWQSKAEPVVVLTKCDLAGDYSSQLVSLEKMAAGVTVCAVRKAIEEGELSQKRWESYRKIKSEAEFVEAKSLLRKNKEARSRSVAGQYRQKKKEKNK